MARKTIKKTKTATKKVVTKKATAKPVERKQNAKKLVAAPVETMHECNCGCHCCCCKGRRFVGLCIKVVLLCLVFLLGCLSSPWIARNAHKPMMPRAAFDDNGCVVLESVKCPKMLEALATADDNADGCITRAEFKNVMSDFHKKPRMQHNEQPEM